MKKMIGMVLLGLGGLAAAIGLTVGALALAGDVGSVVQPTLQSSSPGSSAETPSSSPSVDDHGDDDGTPTASPSVDDHGGDDGGVGDSGSNSGSGSSNSGSGSSNSGSGSDNSGSGSGDD
jgi:hypothetical protein